MNQPYKVTTTTVYFNATTKKVATIKDAIQTKESSFASASILAYTQAEARSKGIAWCNTWELPMGAARLRDEIEDLEWELEIAIREARAVLIQDMRDALDALEAGDYINDCLANIEDITQELNKVGV
tara:strand:+ start:175 stop:555 length:381 start_codon:yes stop_codon:yes gene_type:complete